MNKQPRVLKSAQAFGREWLRSPLRVGAISPSSPKLAANITAGLSEETGPVIELGPGTGIFTQAILDRGVQSDSLAVIELGSSFAETLRTNHPGIHVIEGDASRIECFSPFARGSVGHVVCGLPLLSMPASTVMRILSGSFKLLRPHGAFTLFTYGPQCPVRRDVLGRLGLESRRLSRTLRNIPPATVYELRRVRWVERRAVQSSRLNNNER